MGMSNICSYAHRFRRDVGYAVVEAWGGNGIALPMRRLILFPLVVLMLAACTRMPADEARSPLSAQDTPSVQTAPTPTALSVTPLASPTPLIISSSSDSSNSMDEIAALDAAQPLPRDQMALAQALGNCRNQPICPAVASTEPLDVAVGDVQQFWVINTSDDRNYPMTATLQYAGPVVLMYVEEGARFDQAALEQAAQTFEERIYPRTRAVFGSEWQPGVDGDDRITILNGISASGGVLGYFSSRDSMPNNVNRFSNQREMFFMNINALDFANLSYLDVLAHEFQHMIHRNEQPHTETWFNEGCSTLAEDLNGFVNHGYAATYLFRPDMQLNAWADEPAAAMGHYGASSLFLRYVYAQYAGDQGILPLIRANAGENLDAFAEFAARTRPDITNFADLFADWAVANLIDDPAVGDGRYTYAADHTLPPLLPATVIPEPVSRGEVDGTVHQFGVDYLRLPSGLLTAEFVGATGASLVGTLPAGRYAWWSGRGDNAVSTLTRDFDLRGLETATLRFSTWYEIEADYDYAFISVSTDGGVTWETLPGLHTTDADPQGANYGHGWTGVSGGGERGVWIDEAVNLTPYVGEEIILRFWQITDEGYNAPGMLIDDIILAEADYSDDVEATTTDWQAEGFVRVDGDLPQLWTLRLVRVATDGAMAVEPLPVDAEGRAIFTLSAEESGVLVVAATTPHTTETAGYRLAIR